MNAPATVLRFESCLSARPDAVWGWATSFRGIAAETFPYFVMTAPRGRSDLATLMFQPGRKLFRSWLLFGGLLPLDWSDLTLLELDPGRGFVEQSPMGSMRRWRHVRRLQAQPYGVLLVDELEFEPRALRSLVAWFVTRVFRHRHAVLRRRFGVPGFAIAPDRV